MTGFGLKLLAILGMTANHVAHVFAAMLPGWAVLGLYSFGGLTFPIMAFLIVEGYRYTSSLRRYAGRLALFAALSQIPYWLCFGWPDLDFASEGAVGLGLNVFFTLLIGLGLLWAWDHIRNGAARAAVIAAGVAVSGFCDWGVVGPIMVLLFYVLRSDGLRGVVLTLALPAAALLIPAVAAVALGADTLLDRCNIGYAAVGFTLAAIAIGRYNGQRGIPLKWAFYLYYPAHLLVIWGVHQALVAL